MGVMQKVESIPFQAIMGISDGVLPLVAHNFASGNRKRMNQAVRFALTRGIACVKQAFSLSVFRTGIFDLPIMILFDLLLPMYGVMLVQPLMECCGAVIVVILYKKLR